MLKRDTSSASVQNGVNEIKSLDQMSFSNRASEDDRVAGILPTYEIARIYKMTSREFTEWALADVNLGDERTGVEPRVDDNPTKIEDPTMLSDDDLADLAQRGEITINRRF